MTQLASESLAPGALPGPALTISCCFREASQASIAAAILFPFDMAVSSAYSR
jgi:hypothetical protein